MKKSLIAIICMCALLFCVSCKKEDTGVVTLDSAEQISNTLGIDFKIPSTAKYYAFTVENDIVGKARFTFSGYIFELYASKVVSGDGLFQKSEKIDSTVGLEFDSRAQISVNSYSDGSRSAVWTKNGTNYLAFAQKPVTDDLFLELCDIIIPQ